MTRSVLELVFNVTDEKRNYRIVIDYPKPGITEAQALAEMNKMVALGILDNGYGDVVSPRYARYVVRTVNSVYQA